MRERLCVRRTQATRLRPQRLASPSEAATIRTRWKHFSRNSRENFPRRYLRRASRSAGEVTPATDPRFGDYQSNAALILGKQRGENPRKIAETIIANLAVTEISEQPSVAGAGFINFTLKREAVETKIAALLA